MNIMFDWLSAIAGFLLGLGLGSYLQKLFSELKEEAKKNVKKSGENIKNSGQNDRTITE